MSDCNDLIQIVQDRNEQIRALRQKIVMLEAQNSEWQEKYEELFQMHWRLIQKLTVLLA
jgi:hypothetical protein